MRKRFSVVVMMAALAVMLASPLAVLAKEALHMPPLSELPHDSAGKGYALPWQIGFINAASPVKEKIEQFHHLMLWVITPIVIFVSALLLYAMIRFREKRNPVASKTTHNVLIEVIWTALPVMILVAIAVPSLRLLYFMDATHLTKEDDAKAITLKVVGYQWYWGYEYPDYAVAPYDSYIVPEEELKKGQLRLLETDNHVVVPVDTNVRVQVTAADVIHSWAVPALGVKTDAVPGRLNETWFRITRPGTYYGQCSELCGVKHGFMPIVVDAVSKEQFEKWVLSKGGKLPEVKSAKAGASVPAELPAKDKQL